MHPDWARSLRDQCRVAGVSYFFKQWGEWLPIGQDVRHVASSQQDQGRHRTGETFYAFPDQVISVRVGKKAAGRLLDGREWNEYPGGNDEKHT